MSVTITSPSGIVSALTFDVCFTYDGLYVPVPDTVVRPYYVQLFAPDGTVVDAVGGSHQTTVSTASGEVVLPCTLPAGSLDGLWSVQVTFGDAGGDTGQFSLMASNAYPVPEISAPGAEQTVSGSLTIGVQATDDLGLASARLTLDGGELETWTPGGVTTWSASHVLDTTALLDGRHVLGLTVADTGDLSREARTYFRVRNQASGPAVRFWSPSDGDLLYRDVDVQIHATDPDGLSSLSLKVDGAEVETWAVSGTDACVTTSLASTTYADGQHVLTAIATAADSAAAVDTVVVNCANTSIVYPHFTPQPAVEPWQWLSCYTGFGSTYEGVPHLNLPNGTYSADLEWGLKGTQFLQWNPEWLEDQENPPSTDPTYACRLPRLAALLGMQEQLSSSVLDVEGISDATWDDDGRSMGFLYFWDLARPTGDDGIGTGAIHVGAVDGVGISNPLVLTTLNCYWSTHGRAQGMVLDVLGRTVYRSTGGSSDDPNQYHWQLLRKSTDPTKSQRWSAIGSCQPDPTGRLTSPPAVESEDWIYRLNHASRASSGSFQTREYAYHQPYYGPPVYVNVYEDGLPLAGEIKDGCSAGVGRRHRNKFAAVDPLGVEPTLLWDLSIYGRLFKGASGDDFIGPDGQEHHSFVTTGASEVELPVPLPPLGRLPDYGVDLALCSVVADCIEVAFQDAWVDIDPLMTDPAPGLPTLYAPGVCVACGQIQHTVVDEGDLVLMYATGVSPYGDPRSLRLGFTYHSRSLDGGVWGLSALTRVKFWSSGNVGGALTWQAYVNRGAAGTGYARYYRRHSDESNGEWRAESGFTGQLVKAADGFVETLGADVIEYKVDDPLSSDWLVSKVTHGATGAVHEYTYAENEITITANTEVDTRVRITTEGDYTPKLLVFEVLSPQTSEWEEYYSTEPVYEDGLLTGFATEGCLSTISYTSSGETTLVSGWEDAEGHAWSATYAVGGAVATVANPDDASVQYLGWFEGIDEDNFWEADCRALACADNELGQRLYYHWDAPDATLRFTMSTLRGDGARTYHMYDYPNAKPAIVVDALTSPTYYTYDDRLNPLTRTDALGRVTGYEYTTKDQYVGETDPLNLRTYYRYDEVGRLVADTDKGGSTAYHNYDEDGVLRSLVDRRGYATYYDYVPDLCARAETNARGDVTYHLFDDYGRVSAVSDPLGNPTYYEYDGRWRVVKTTDAFGYYTSDEYDGAGNVAHTWDQLEHETSYEYSFRGQLETATDTLGYYTRDEYDAAGNRFRHTDQLQYFTYYAFDNVGRTYYTEDFLGGRTVNLWDRNDRLTGVRDPLGNWTYYEYDQVGNQTAVVDALAYFTYHYYDDGDRRYATRDPLGYFTYYEHDPLGRQTAVRDPLGNTTATYFDPEGHQVWTRDALGRATYSYYDEVGRLYCTQDACEARTYYEYDAAGRQTAVLDPLLAATYYDYDEVGSQTAVKDALGNVTYSYYDAARRLYATRNALAYFTYYEHDALNRQTATRDALGYFSYTEYDARGSVVTTVNPRTYFTYYYYDPLNRQFCTRDMLQRLTYLEYDAGGRTTASLDPGHKATYYHYDALGRTEATVAPSGAASYMYYDERGQVSRSVSPDQVTTYFAYDPASRQVKITDLLGQSTVTYYDAAGQVWCQVDPAHQPTYYEYDPAGRQTAVTNPDHDTVYHHYDAAGRQTALIDPRGGPTTYRYDALGQLRAETDALGRATTYDYDPLGQRLWRLDPENRRTYYFYDVLGRPSCQEFSKLTFWEGGLRHGSLLIGLNSPGFATASTQQVGGPVYFAYDENGNRTMMQSPTGTVYWTYDELDRMVSEEEI